MEIEEYGLVIMLVFPTDISVWTTRDGSFISGTGGEILYLASSTGKADKSGTFRIVLAI